jgi:hypothetical protein
MQAKRDENRVTTLLCALNTDGVTPQPVSVDPTRHIIMVHDGATGSDFSVVDAPRDENRIPVAMAVSSADGVTPVELYADIDGHLLIKST